MFDKIPENIFLQIEPKKTNNCNWKVPRKKLAFLQFITTVFFFIILNCTGFNFDMAKS